MIRALLVVGAAGILGLGVAAGWYDSNELEETETVVETTTETETAESGSGFPIAVEETRAALLDAARSGNYEALQPLIPETGFTYTFGGEVEGGAIPYWQQLERDTNEKPLETLEALLEMPPVLTRGIYVWPWAYTVASADDRDEMGICIEPAEYVAGLRVFNQWVYRTQPEGGRARAGNPSTPP